MRKIDGDGEIKANGRDEERGGGTRIWMKKTVEKGDKRGNRSCPGERRSIAIRVNATPSRDPELEIFVAEADRQTRDP